MTSDKIKKLVFDKLGPETDEFLRDLDREINVNPVSGRPDARQLEDDLEGIVNYARRKDDRRVNDEKTYIVMIDIDRFGDFNKDYGQEVGDKVLIEVNTIIAETLREDDQYPYHLHGEEMEAIYRCGNLEDALKVAERVRKEVEEKSKEQTGHRVTISLGLTEYRTEEEEHSIAEARADRYMQIAKKEGRNRTYCGETDPLLNLKERLYQPGIPEAVAKQIAESVKGAKGLIGRTMTNLYKRFVKD